MTGSMWFPNLGPDGDGLFSYLGIVVQHPYDEDDGGGVTSCQAPDAASKRGYVGVLGPLKRVDKCSVASSDSNNTDSVVDQAFFDPSVQVTTPSVTTDDVSLFSVLHGDCNGTMPVKCATNYTEEGVRARYQHCGKDRCGGPACTATEPVFATGGTGNNMPPEDEFEVWVIVCHKRTKECYKFFPSRHDLSVCV